MKTFIEISKNIIIGIVIFIIAYLWTVYDLIPVIQYMYREHDYGIYPVIYNSWVDGVLDSSGNIIFNNYVFIELSLLVLFLNGWLIRKVRGLPRKFFIALVVMAVDSLITFDFQYLVWAEVVMKRY